MEHLTNLIRKFCTKEIIFYVIFGVLTTVVNIACFYFFTHFVHSEENISNAISIILAILFAYFTNRSLVFNSTANGIKERFLEFGKFILGRTFTMIVELIRIFPNV